MSITYNSSATPVASGANVTSIAATLSVSAGDFVRVSVATYSSVNSIGSLSMADSSSNTWTQLGTTQTYGGGGGSGSGQAAVWWSQITTGGSLTFTVTSTASLNMVIYVDDYTVTAGNTVSLLGSAATATGNSASPASGALSFSGTGFVMAFIGAGSTQTFTALTSGFTQRGTIAHDIASLSFDGASQSSGINPGCTDGGSYWAAIAGAFTSSLPATFTVSPRSLPISQTGQTVTVTGTNTAWTGGTTFTLSGSGNSVTAASVNASTQVATLTVTTGSTVGEFAFTDSVDSASGWFVVGNFIQPSSTAGSVCYYPPNAGYQQADGSVVFNGQGNYFRVGFTGTSVKPVLAGGGYTDQITFLAYVDDGTTSNGGAGAWCYNQALSNSSLGVVSMASGFTSGSHQFRCDIISQSGQDEWTANPPVASVALRGVLLDASDSGQATPYYTKKCLWYSASTGAGIMTDRTPSTASSTTTDASHSPVALLQLAMNWEYATVCFTSNGYVATSPSANNAPAFPTAYPYFYNGVYRINPSTGLLLSQPDYLVVYKGDSDFTAGESGSSVQAAAAGMWAAFRAMAPSSIFVKVIPVSNPYVSNFLAAFASVFGGHVAIATAGGGNATLYRATNDSNAYLVDMGSNIGYGLQNLNSPIFRPQSIAGVDDVHPDVAQNGRIVAILGYFMGVIGGGGGGGGGGYYSS